MEKAKKDKRDCFGKDEEISQIVIFVKKILGVIIKNKLKISIILTVATVCILLFVSKAVMFSYKVYVGKWYIGCVKSREDVENTVKKAAKVKGFTNDEYSIFPALMFFADYSGEDEMVYNFLASDKGIKEGVGVKVGSKIIFATENEGEAVAFTESYKGLYKNGDTVKTEVDAEIQFIKGFYMKSEFADKEKAFKRFEEAGVKVLSTQKDKTVFINGENPDAWCAPVVAAVSSEFGQRWGRKHNGIDIAANEGESVVSVADGRVHFASWSGGYGNLIIIDHGNNVQTYYAHLSTIGVKEGDTVSKNTEIGKVGNTGNSTGPHLHFEVRIDNVAQNPMEFIGF